MTKQTNDHDKPSPQRSEFVKGQFNAVETSACELADAINYRVGLFAKAWPEKKKKQSFSIKGMRYWALNIFGRCHAKAIFNGISLKKKKTYVFTDPFNILPCC